MSETVSAEALITAFVRSGPDLGGLREALDRLGDESHDAALLELARRLRGSPTQTSWVSALEYHAFLRGAPGRWRDDRAVAAIERQHWSRATDPFEILEGVHGGPSLHPVYSRLLFLLDPTAWCRALDAHAVPSNAEEFARWSDGSFAETLRVLRSARDVYTPDGRWTRSVASIVLIDRALDDLDGRSAPSTPGVDPWDATAHRDLLALTDAVESRRDGHLLALGFLALATRRHLADDPATARVAPHLKRWMPHLEAILLRRHVAPSVLGELLVARWGRGERTTLPRPSPRLRSDFGAQRANVEGFSLLIAAAAPALQRDDRAELDALWSLVVEAFERRDPGAFDEPRAGANGQWTPRWGHLSRLLARMPDPVEAFERACGRLEPVLERLPRFIPDDHNVALCPLALSLLGCVAATIVPSGAPPPTWATSLREHAFHLAVRVLALDPFDSLGRADETVLVCIELALARDGDGTASDIAALLRPLDDQPERIVRAAGRLRRRGISGALIHEALLMLRHDVDTVCHDAREALRLGLVRHDARNEVEASLALLGASVLKPATQVPPVFGATLLSTEEGRALWRFGPVAALQRGFGVDRAFVLITAATPLTQATARWAIEHRPDDPGLDAELMVAVGSLAEGATVRDVHVWDGLGGERALVDTIGTALAQRDPFDRRAPVRGNLHFGRAPFIEELADAIVGTRMTGVFGLRRVGKTSAVYAALDRTRDAVLPVWIDVQGVVRRDVRGLTAALTRAALRAGVSRSRVEHAGGDATEVFTAALDAVREFGRLSNRVPCVVLDEFDLLFSAQDDREGIERVFDHLASECAAGQIAVVAIGRDARRFQDARRLSTDRRSLVGQMEARWLPPLSREDAVEMLTGLARRAGKTFPLEHIATAYTAAGGHPLLLRLYGRVYLEMSTRAEAPAEVTTTLGRFLETSDVGGVVGDALALLADCFPQEWRSAVPHLHVGSATLSPAPEEPWLGAFRAFGLVREDGHIPDVFVRLAPVVGPSVSEAA
jgi:hypothetical protein